MSFFAELWLLPSIMIDRLDLFMKYSGKGLKAKANKCIDTNKCTCANVKGNWHNCRKETLSKYCITCQLRSENVIGDTSTDIHLPGSTNERGLVPRSHQSCESSKLSAENIEDAGSAFRSL